MSVEPAHRFSLVVPTWVTVGICVIASVVAALVVFRDMQRRRRSNTREVISPPQPYVYIAGGSSERLTVCQIFIGLATKLGVRVTADWTRDPGWDLERTRTNDEFRESARQDLAAIRRADIVWLIVPAAKSEGASAELGYAIALRKRIVVSGETGARNIFTLLADPRDVFDRHEDALRHIARLSRRRESAPS